MTYDTLHSPTFSKLIPREVQGEHCYSYFMVKDSKAQRVCDL